MKLFAGIWIASLPKEMEGRSIFSVEFVSPKMLDMKMWKPTISLARYTPEGLLFKERGAESLMDSFHLAKTQVEIKNNSTDSLMEIAREVVYPRIRRATLIVDISSRTGHIYVSTEVIFRLKDGVRFATWIGRSSGLPQGEVKEDLYKIMEEALRLSNDKSFKRRIERALLAWGEARTEPEEELRTAKLWTALETLLQRKNEPVWKTVRRRSIALARMKTRESIDLFSVAGWRSAFNPTNLNSELDHFLKDAYNVRNLVYHRAEKKAQRIGFALDLGSFTQVIILKMVEFAQKKYTWDEAVAEIDRRAQDLQIEER